MQYTTKRLKWVIFHISIGGYLFSYNLTILNSSIENIACTLNWNSHKTLFFILSNFLMPLGALLGGLNTGWLSSTYGRRYTILLSDSIMVLGTVLSIIPFTETFLIGRLLLGAASGMLLTILPVYINELIPESLIPSFGPFVQISTDVGLVSAYIICLPLPTSNYSENWLNNWWIFMMVFPGLLSIYQFWYFLSVFSFDSPVWYLQQGKKQEALKVFEYLYPDEDSEDVLRKGEIAEETDGLLLEEKSSYMSLFTDKRYKKLLVIAIALAVIQQLSGINMCVMYSSYVFNKVGNTVLMSRIYTTVSGLVFLVASLSSIPLLSRFGRKTLILFGEFTLSLTMLGLGLIILFDLNSILSVIFIGLFYIFYAFTLGAALWTYLSELMTEKLMSVSTSVNFLLVCIVSLIFPVVAETFELAYPFFFFSFAMLAGLWFSWQYLIETKGKSRKENLILLGLSN